MIGCAHGRFQPFHNEHLDYILSAFEHCDHLVIGITQPDIHILNSIHHNKKRTDLFCNPLTYDERVDMITRVLNSLDINSNRYSFIKFHIDKPDKILSGEISKDWTFFTTIREQWNKNKIATLENIDLKVKVLYEDYSIERITSTKIRSNVIAGDQSWKQQVPKACSSYLEEIGFPERLSKL